MPSYVITGANRGIGLELCRQLTDKGNEVIAVCRTASSALKELPLMIIERVDVSSEQDLHRLKDALSGKAIDVLINNAGVWGDETIGEFAAQKIASVISTNAIAPLLVTQYLLANLHHGSKVIMITSRMGSIADNDTGGRYSYRMSKAALNAATKSLSIDMKEKGIIVGLIHPGWVATDMGGPQGVPVVEAARNIIQRIDEYDLETSGVFKHANGQLLPW